MLRVKKRDGQLEEALFDKVTNRIKYLCKGVLKDNTRIGVPLNIGYSEIARNVIANITDGISTRQLDEYAAKLCATYVDESYEYAIIAGRIAVSNHHKNTLNSFCDTVKLLYENCDHLGNSKPLLNKTFYKSVMRNRCALESMIDYERDYNLDYFGFKTLESSYFISRSTPTITVTERPQHIYMRIAVALHGDNLELVKETYDLLSQGYVSHASPTMYNAGTVSEQLASCFLLGMKDSMDEDGGIPDCWKSCAMISKRAGGLGLSISTIRSEGAPIYGVNGTSNGIIPLIKCFNDIVPNYVNQGGRRKGALAIYLEPWHPEIINFLELKRNHGKEEMRARDLYYALWIPDIFMRRVEQAISEDRPVRWTLMCPDSSYKQGYPRLYDVYGTEFDKIYEEYERDGLGVGVVNDIRQIWLEILKSQKETGVPYMLYKDHINNKSNQANIGVIRTSNLCAEIVEYSDHQEHAVCNLASIVLQQFVKTTDTGEKYYDFNHLFKVVYRTFKNLDLIIDINFYPTPETRRSNLKHRPIGLGVQGLANAFILMRYNFDSAEAERLNRKIFETIYFGCITASMELARDREIVIKDIKAKHGDNITFTPDGLEPKTDLGLNLIQAEYNRTSHLGSYSSFIGSPISQGKFQFDLWNEKPDAELAWDWNTLRQHVMQYGVRNSLTTAVMPTASTASILKSIECIEPLKSNLYTRRVKGGEYVLINQYLQEDLIKLGLWNNTVRRKLVANRGSIQDIEEIPQNIKDLYKTAFELKQKSIIDLARSRGPFIDQTQSMNGFFKTPTDQILTNFHIYGWKSGLKTGMYYCRRIPITAPIQFTVDNQGKGHAVVIQESDTDCANCGA